MPWLNRNYSVDSFSGLFRLSSVFRVVAPVRILLFSWSTAVNSRRWATWEHGACCLQFIVGRGLGHLALEQGLASLIMWMNEWSHWDVENKNEKGNRILKISPLWERGNWDTWLGRLSLVPFLITRSYKLDLIYTLEGISGQCPSVKDFFFFF